MRVPPTRSASRCAPRARSTSPRRSSRLRACCSRWRRGRTRTSPTSRATSGPRSSRRCRPTTSSTRCSGGRARMPQHARRLKIRRKDLRKPDEFETPTGPAPAWQGDQAAAATAYGEYVASAADFDYLRQEALVGLARAKEASGDTAGALDAYTQAGALPGPYRDDALLSAARLEQAAGHADLAQAIYAGLVKDAADPETKGFPAAEGPRAARPAGGGAG